MLIVGRPGLPGCNSPGKELLKTFENWLACGVACCTLIPGVTPAPTSWVEQYEVGHCGLLNSAAPYWCQKMECGALRAADRTSVICEVFQNFARSGVWMTQELSTASGRKMYWNNLQSLIQVQLGCANHLELPQLGPSVRYPNKLSIH